jgi:hypothetical protein
LVPKRYKTNTREDVKENFFGKVVITLCFLSHPTGEKAKKMFPYMSNKVKVFKGTKQKTYLQMAFQREKVVH